MNDMIFGRDAELTEIADLLDQWPIVTIVGPGGVGKTTVAREVAATMGRFEFVDLSTATGADLHSVIAGALGAPSIDEIAHVSAETLIVLDNCEHIADQVSAVTEALAVRGSRRVLATSRLPLAAVHERVYILHPMSLVGSPSPAAQMLAEMIEARGVGGNHEDSDLEGLAAQLDGLPLAMELAASRTATLTPSEIRGHITTRLDLLSRQRGRVQDRHQSLNAAIGWSHDLLDPTQRQGLVRLGVFDSAFNAGCAAAAMGVEATEAVSILGELVDQSLLKTTEIASQTWYRLYETVRVFCLERLTEPELLAAAGRVVEEAVEIATGLTFPREKEHSLEVQQTVQAMFPIWKASIERSLAIDPDPSRAFAMLVPMWWMEDMGRQLEVAGMADRVLDHWPGEVFGERATVLAVRATMLRVVNRPEEAADAVALVQRSGDRGHGRVISDRVEGMILRGRGDFARSKLVFESAAELATEIGFDALAAELQMHIALDEARSGKIGNAVDRLRSALRRPGTTGLTVPWLQTTLAYILIPTEPDQAAAVLGEVLDGHAGPLDPWSEGSAHEQLGYIAGVKGDPVLAARHFAKAVGVFERHHILPGMWGVVWGAASLFGANDDQDLEGRTLALAEEMFGSPVVGPFELDMYEAIAGHQRPDPAGTSISLSRLRSHLERIASSGQTRSPEDVAVVAEFTRRGDIWVVSFDGVSTSVRDSKGMVDIATLLSSPGQEVGALDLMGSVVAQPGTGEVLDAEARNQLRQRLRQLSDDIDDAVSLGADDVAEGLRTEMEAISAHLGAAYGLGGKPRTQGETAEKARSAVTWRIRSAIRRIRDVNPSGGDHLDRFISTGRFCVYDPPSPVDWRVD